MMTMAMVMVLSVQIRTGTRYLSVYNIITISKESVGCIDRACNVFMSSSIHVPTLELARIRFRKVVATSAK